MIEEYVTPQDDWERETPEDRAREQRLGCSRASMTQNSTPRIRLSRPSRAFSSRGMMQKYISDVRRMYPGNPDLLDATKGYKETRISNKGLVNMIDRVHDMAGIPHIRYSGRY